MRDTAALRWFLLPALAAALAGAAPAGAQTCAPARTALVLSGGGAKGFAHVGVLRTLDSLGQRPDLIVGTSMGSVIGALYAGGMTGRQIDSLIRHAPGGQFIRTFEVETPRTLAGLRPLVVFAQGEGVTGVQPGAVSERDVNALLDQYLLLPNLRARGDFDSLAIPFRAVAADVHARIPVVLGRGDLARAVRASIAIPIVFPPEEVDGRYLADGGIVANIPVGIARGLGATRVIVSDVSTRLPDTTSLFSSSAMLLKLTEYLFEQPRDSLRAEDVLVKHPVDDFDALDFAPRRTAALLALGRRAADSALAGAGCLATLRGAQPLVLPPLPRVVGRIAPEGADEAMSRAVVNDLGLRRGDSIPYPILQRRIPYLAETGMLNAAWLYPSGRGDTVDLAPRTRMAPRLYAAGGFAYDLDLGGRIWLASLGRDFGRFNVETLALLRLGGLRDETELGLRRNRRVRWPLFAPVATFNIATESFPGFTSFGAEGTGRTVAASEQREAIGFAGLEPRLRHGWSFALGAEYRTWWDNPAFADGNGAAFVARLDRFTRFDAPRLEAKALLGDYRYALVDLQLPWRAGSFEARLHLRAGAANDAPPTLTFLLGGLDGFPGVELGELRGDREASGQLRVTHPLVGPVRLGLDLGVGRVAFGGRLLGEGGWQAGVRLGAGISTPLGPLAVGYGVATEGRNALYMRLLRWF